jgi:hypothetical protein
MEIHRNSNRKNRRFSLFFHLFVLSLAVVIDLPRSLPSLLTADGLIQYTVSRIFPLVVFYLCFLWLVPVYLARRKFVAFFAMLLVVINGVTFIGYLCMQVLHHLFYEQGPLKLFYFLKMHLSGVTAMTVAAVFGTVFRIVMGWYGEMQQKQLLEQEKLRSELALLKAQVNPHFLFNTLNNIDSLIHTDAEKASEALIKLSTLLRYVIYDAVRDLVPLQLEIDHIRAYIELQRLRYAGGKGIVLEVTGETGNRLIAPMLLIPFLENAFKHSDSAGVARGLEIRIHIRDKGLDFLCTNYIAEKTPEQNGGFGLDNVRKRLEHQYASRYTLRAAPEQEQFVTHLTVETE